MPNPYKRKLTLKVFFFKFYNTKNETIEMSILIHVEVGESEKSSLVIFADTKFISIGLQKSQFVFGFVQDLVKRNVLL